MDNLQAKILIVGPSWVGDMVMAQSLFKVLRNLYSDCIIDVLAPAWSLPILERMPEVRRGIAMPVGHGALHLKVRYQVGKSLRAEKYTWSIVLPNSLKSALVPCFAKIPRRTGWRGEMRYGWLNDLRPLNEEKYPLMVQRFTALAYPPVAETATVHPKLDCPPPRCPHPHLIVKTDNLELLENSYALDLSRPILSLCPGAEFGPAKRWPAAHYAVVAAEKIRQGWQVWIFGSAKDKEVAEHIYQLLESVAQTHCKVLAGATQLSEAVDLMSLSAAVVSNDSGLMHIAAALSLPLVVIYGSTSPGFTPPLSDKVRIVSEPIDCAPCFQRQCPLGHLKCLQDLAPQKVVMAIDQLVGGDLANLMSLPHPITLQ
jgi:heptosyltransferase-2